MKKKTNNAFGQYIYSELVVIHISTLVTTVGSC